MNNREREESVTLEILEAIEAQSDVTQRHLARRTGIALGLANSYLKRCVRKGLVKMQQAPANRYVYYLTPKGFAEKSRLTAQYLSYSFTFYRRAANSCGQVFDQCKWAGWNNVALCGASDLAEIASLRAIEHGVNIVALYDPDCDEARFANNSVVTTLVQRIECDAWMLTDLNNPQAFYDCLSKEVVADRIVVPAILGVRQRGLSQ
jgi:predicted transcriptional regulator